MFPNSIKSDVRNTHSMYRNPFNIYKQLIFVMYTPASTIDKEENNTTQCDPPSMKQRRAFKKCIVSIVLGRQTDECSF